MTNRWYPRGAIEVDSVTHVALSPNFAADRTAFAVTPAGVSVSRDAGKTWKAPARGMLGPFVRDLALSPEFAADRVALATSPAGLFRSEDGGRRWMFSPFEAGCGPLLVSPDGIVYVASADANGTLWRGQIHNRLLVEPVGSLGTPPLALTADATGAVIWAIGEAGVLESRDQGESWQAFHVPESGARVQAITDCGFGTLAVGSEEDGLFLRRRDGAWEAPEALRGLGVTAVVARSDSTIVAGTPEGAFVSRDEGRTWEAPTVGAPILCLALSADASSLWAGLVGKGCLRSDDLGRTWQRAGRLHGTVVAEAGAASDRLEVRTVEGFVFRSSDAGNAWDSHAVLGNTMVRALAKNASTGVFSYLSGTHIVVDDRHVVPAPRRGEFQHLAVTGDAPPVIAGAEETQVFVSRDLGKTWEPTAPPLGEGETIVDLAFGQPGAREDRALAVATRDHQGRGTVWLRLGTQAWRRAITHPRAVTGVRLAVVEGPRGLFAALGESIYRPARVGAMLFAGAAIGRGDDCESLQLVATRGADTAATLAVLTTDGLYVSSDGGLGWDRLRVPDGPPLTSIALRGTPDGPELVVFRLGGAVQTHLLGEPRDRANGEARRPYA